jgi:hypothetical protein
MACLLKRRRADQQAVQLFSLRHKNYIAMHNMRQSPRSWFSLRSALDDNVFEIWFSFCATTSVASTAAHLFRILSVKYCVDKTARYPQMAQKLGNP